MGRLQEAVTIIKKYKFFLISWVVYLAMCQVPTIVYSILHLESLWRFPIMAAWIVLLCFVIPDVPIPGSHLPCPQSAVKSDMGSSV